MTTLEITISDDSKLENFIAMLKEFRFVSEVQLGVKKISKKEKLTGRMLSWIQLHML